MNYIKSINNNDDNDNISKSMFFCLICREGNPLIIKSYLKLHDVDEYDIGVGFDNACSHNLDNAKYLYANYQVACEKHISYMGFFAKDLVYHNKIDALLWLKSLNIKPFIFQIQVIFWVLVNQKQTDCDAFALLYEHFNDIVQDPKNEATNDKLENTNENENSIDLLKNNLDSIYVYNCNTTIGKILTFIEEIPDKIIRDDMVNALAYHNFIQNKNKNTSPPINVFNDIYEGKLLCPDTLGLSYGFDSNNRLKLYGGGFGMGHYHEVSFDSSTQQYIYTLLTNANKERNDLYTHSNWDEFRSLIFNHIMHN